MIEKRKLAGHERISALYYDSLSTKAGNILVYVDEDKKVVGIYFSKKPSRKIGSFRISESKNDPEMCKKAIRQLREYFEGNRKTFDLEYNFNSATDFQKKVWKALLDIPFGTTLTYGELAKQIGKTNAYRAVGNAAGANPIPICIPCHRLVASGGKLGGYSGGIATKVILLDHEKTENRKG